MAKQKRTVYTPVCVHLKTRIAVVNGKTQIICADCGAVQD